jgi:hypothetical protein
MRHGLARGIVDPGQFFGCSRDGLFGGAEALGVGEDGKLTGEADCPS